MGKSKIGQSEAKIRQRIRQGLLLLFFILFPVVLNFLSPYLSVSGAAEGIASGSLMFFGLLLLSSLVLGRAFCGWVCPGGAAQEMCLAVNDRRVRPRRQDWIKYLIWVPWLSAIVLLSVRAGGIRRIEPLYSMDSIISVDAPGRYIIYYFILALIMVPAIAVGRRTMCHSICWMAPFMVLGRKLRNLLRWPALRLKAEPERCTACGSCTSSCPMSLEVQAMVEKARLENGGCILCGRCVDSCPRKVIRYSFSKGV